MCNMLEVLFASMSQKSQPQSLYDVLMQRYTVGLAKHLLGYLLASGFKQLLMMILQRLLVSMNDINQLPCLYMTFRMEDIHLWI